MEWYVTVLRKSLVITGRARRKEYWMFTLFDTIIYILLLIVDYGLFDKEIISEVYRLLMFIPYITVGIRRMHDTDNKGWFLLIPIYNLILCLREGTIGENDYGEDPKNLNFEVEKPYID